MLTLIDTDILSLFFRNDPNVVNRFREYTKDQPAIHFSILTYYEIVSGLMHRDAHKQMERCCGRLDLPRLGSVF
jgi:tRNA(fMet)-specific endonuclease VapC